MSRPPKAPPATAASTPWDAFVAGGRVLILDEPTASLDVAAEVALFDQLGRAL